MRLLILVVFWMVCASMFTFASADPDDTSGSVRDDLGALSIPSQSFGTNYYMTYQPSAINPLAPRRQLYELSISHSNYWGLGNRYLLDGEITQYSLSGRVGLGGLEIGATLRFIWQGGGIFDSAIVWGHRTIGIPLIYRNQLPKDKLMFISYSPQTGFTYKYWREELRINDLIISKKVSILRDYISSTTSFRIPLDSLVKGFGCLQALNFRIPVDSVDFLLGTALAWHEGHYLFDIPLLDLHFSFNLTIKANVHKSVALLLGFYGQSPITAEPKFDTSDWAFEMYSGIQFGLGDLYYLQIAAINNGIGNYFNSPTFGLFISISKIVIG